MATLEGLRSSVIIPPFDVEATAGGGVGRGVMSVAALPSAVRAGAQGGRWWLQCRAVGLLPAMARERR